VRRLSLLTLFASALAFSLWSGPTQAQGNRVQSIADGVWFRLGETEQGHCNNVIIDLGESLLIVDANFPSGAQALMADLKRISSKPVKYVFDTHHHGDHAYGNPVWTKAGATTLAYVGVAEEIARYEPMRWREASGSRKDVGDLNLETLEPPNRTFKDSPHVLEEGDRRVELHHFGWAHTRGDGFVWLPEQKILCTGDAAVNGAFNYTGDGNTANWPNVIRGAEGLGAERVLPGHGPAGGPEILAGQRAFFEDINAKVRRHFEQGKKIEDVVTIEDGRGTATVVEPADEVENWVGDSYAEQVRVRFAELTAGKPHGEILGGR